MIVEGFHPTKNTVMVPVQTDKAGLAAVLQSLMKDRPKFTVLQVFQKAGERAKQQFIFNGKKWRRSV